MVQIRLASISIGRLTPSFLTVMALLLFFSNSPTPCDGHPADSHTTAKVDLLPRTPTQLSTGAFIVSRSPLPKKKGGGGRVGKGGRPGTGDQEVVKGAGGRGFRTVGGGGGVADPRLTGERPGTGTARPGVEGGKGDRGRGFQTGGKPRPIHGQGSAHPLGEGNAGRNGVPGSRGRCPDGRRRIGSLIELEIQFVHLLEVVHSTGVIMDHDPEGTFMQPPSRMQSATFAKLNATTSQPGRHEERSTQIICHSGRPEET
ncbi:hypothetical protein KEM48_013437, partial [Puccinia striiformis f. sp. tritici PST-130]